MVVAALVVSIVAAAVAVLSAGAAFRWARRADGRAEEAEQREIKAEQRAEEAEQRAVDAGERARRAEERAESEFSDNRRARPTARYVGPSPDGDRCYEFEVSNIFPQAAMDLRAEIIDQRENLVSIPDEQHRNRPKVLYSEESARRVVCVEDDAPPANTLRLRLKWKVDTDRDLVEHDRISSVKFHD